MIDIVALRSSAKWNIDEVEKHVAGAKKLLESAEADLLDAKYGLIQLLTAFVEMDGVVFEYFTMSDKQVTSKDIGLKAGENTGEYFYSLYDKRVHPVSGSHGCYFYDENNQEHINTHVHRVIASSDKAKYPSLNELTVKDLVNTQYKK